MNTNDKFFVWAVATPFMGNDGLYWYFHNVQLRLGSEVIPGRVRQMRGFELNSAKIDFFPDGNIRLRSEKNSTKLRFHDTSKKTSHLLKNRVLVFIQYHIDSQNIQIMSATTAEDFQDLINRNAQFRYLSEPERYRVELYDYKEQCTGTMPYIIEKVRSHFKVRNNDQLKAILEGNVVWNILVGKEYVPLTSTPFLMRRVLKGQSAG